jgi:hypothetical protein
MVTKAKKNPRLTEELLETAKDMRASGILVRLLMKKLPSAIWVRGLPHPPP